LQNEQTGVAVVMAAMLDIFGWRCTVPTSKDSAARKPPSQKHKRSTSRKDMTTERFCT